jgi:hypothetical protein
MTFIIDNFDKILVAAAGFIAFASFIANFTPTQTDNKIVAFLTKLVDFLALNFKK